MDFSNNTTCIGCGITIQKGFALCRDECGKPGGEFRRNPDWPAIEKAMEEIMNNPTEENLNKLTHYLEYEITDN